MAASMLAGDSIFGSLSMEITEMMMLSTPWMGLHLSAAVSWELYWSVPGGCKMEMQTLPSGYTREDINWSKRREEGDLLLGCHILVTNFITGGLLG